MSCDLANGRLEVCKDAVGGIETVYFINYGDFNPEVDVTYTAGTDTIATIANVTSLYKYELKGTNSFEQVVTSSRENGTTFVEQTLTMTLKKQDATTHKSVKLLAYGRPQIVVRNRNNQFFLMGLEHGADGGVYAMLEFFEDCKSVILKPPFKGARHVMQIRLARVM